MSLFTLTTFVGQPLAMPWFCAFPMMSRYYKHRFQTPTRECFVAGNSLFQLNSLVAKSQKYQSLNFLTQPEVLTHSEHSQKYFHKLNTTRRVNILSRKLNINTAKPPFKDTIQHKCLPSPKHNQNRIKKVSGKIYPLYVLSRLSLIFAATEIRTSGRRREVWTGCGVCNAVHITVHCSVQYNVQCCVQCSAFQS